MAAVSGGPELVVRRYRQGWSQTQIADAAGINRHLVRTILVAQGVQLRPPPGPVTAYPTDPAWWVERFAPVLEAGVWRRATVREVSAQFGVTKTVILRRLTRLEVPAHLVTPVPPPGPVPTPDQAQRWLSQTTQPDGTCRRWVFARTPTGQRERRRYPVTRYAGTRVTVTRLVWSWQHGPVPPGHDIDHTPSCRFADCVRPDHLTCTTAGDRIADQAAHGVFPRGDQHWAAKLTEDQARHILTSPLPHQELATRYGVSLATIQAIRTHRRWKHL